MSISEKVKRRQRKEMIQEIIRHVILALLLLLMLNKIFFKIELFDANKAAAVLGNGIKPSVTLNSKEAAVYFLDIGQGDSSLIMTETHTVLIDGGDLESGDIIVGSLNSLGVKRLDHVIITHPHVDHFGGMFEVLSSFPVGSLLMPEVPEDMIPRTMNYSKLLASIDLYDVKCEYVKTGDSFSLGDDSQLEIIAPLYNDYSELNNLSVVAKFTHCENSFLFTGDLESAAERDLLNAQADLNADVLKAGHHGSAGASSAEFLEAVTPKIAVFEAGFYNTFGHPRAAVLERLNKAGCSEAYCTSLNGNIALISDGINLRAEIEKNSVISLDFYG